MKTTLYSFLLSLLSLNLFAQTLPPIFATAKKGLLKSEVVAALGKNIWLENMVIADDGCFYVTNYPAGIIYKVDRQGQIKQFARIFGKIAGIRQSVKRDRFFVSGWDSTGKAALFVLSRTGEVEKTMLIPGGQFPNGMLNWRGTSILIADSFAGCIWLFDPEHNTIGLWLKDALLERSSEKSPYPAANGLKARGKWLYVSNTEKQLLIRVPIEQGSPGKPEIFLNKVNIDDFDFDPLGNIYAATNVYNSVIRISPNKNVTIVGDESTGAAGSTAIAYSASDKAIYVSTSGGMAFPPPGGVQDGKIIKIELNQYSAKK
jgi:hypothetical protein